MILKARLVEILIGLFYFSPSHLNLSFEYSFNLLIMAQSN